MLGEKPKVELVEVVDLDETLITYDQERNLVYNDALIALIALMLDQKTKMEETYKVVLVTCNNGYKYVERLVDNMNQYYADTARRLQQPGHCHFPDVACKLIDEFVIVQSTDKRNALLEIYNKWQPTEAIHIYDDMFIRSYKPQECFDSYMVFNPDEGKWAKSEVPIKKIDDLDFNMSEGTITICNEKLHFSVFDLPFDVKYLESKKTRVQRFFFCCNKPNAKNLSQLWKTQYISQIVPKQQNEITEIIDKVLQYPTMSAFAKQKKESSMTARLLQPSTGKAKGSFY